MKRPPKEGSLPTGGSRVVFNSEGRFLHQADDQIGVKEFQALPGAWNAYLPVCRISPSGLIVAVIRLHFNSM